MAVALVRRLAPGIFLTGANGFAPFAGVEELKPQRLRDFCGEAEVNADGRPGLRWCQNSVSKTLEDGGEVELSWRMRADPDSILSLDTEAEEGVRVVRCSPDELELELPDSHMGHVEPGKLVVGSRFVHGCDHAPDKQLYRRVAAAKVQGLKPGARAIRKVLLTTEDLPSFAHAVPSMSFSFSYMPIEALDVVTHPEMRTDYGINREYLNRRQRRLFGPFDLAKRLAKMKGVDSDDGGFKAAGHSGGTINTKNGILNFVPKQVSNFGWNWDFFMNATEEPNYNITEPGMQAVIRVRKPYVKVHAGIYLNFTSEFGGLTAVPKVKWDFGMRGHGYVQGRVLAVLNTTSSSTDVDPAGKFALPLLKKLHSPQWFQKIEFATGHMPISFEPGFQFKANMYHTGTFHGAVAFGGKTHGVVTPVLSYDSQQGFDVRWNGTFKNVTFIPPLWMIFTKRFELGVLLKPTLLMRGDFAGLEKATFAIEFRPYVNMTITRDGDNDTAYQADDTKSLTVYPYRVMGITDLQVQKKYKVKIDMLGQSIETTPEMNWGQVGFHDHVSKFCLGETTEQSVIEQVVTVTLYEVDDSQAVPTQRSLGMGQVQCTSLLNGVCHPSPPIAKIMQGTIEVAAVELAIIWQDLPEPWFASKIRGVGVSFPQVALRQDALASSFPPAGSGQPPEALTMHLIHDGLTYIVPIQGDPSQVGATLHGNNVVEFGPGFLETWLPCSAAAGSRCESPRLELYYGQKQVAVANLPQIEWTSSTAMEGTRSSFMASSSTMTVPCSVVLYAPGSTTSSIAVVTMNAKVVSPASASFVLEPTSAAKVPLTTNQRVAWTISEVDTSQEYFFTLQPLKLVNVLPSQMQNFVAYRKVGQQVLEPIVNHSETVTMKCSAIAIGGMSASEAPCSFAHTLPIGLGFAVGDQAVVRIAWSDNGEEHEMYSLPFVVVPKAPTRRLNTPRELPTPLRRLSAAAFKKKWDNKMGQHQKSCDTKNLHFDLGAGVMFRGRVDNVGVPKGFPMLGGLDEAPELTTGFRKIMAMKPGTDATKLLPASLCKGGLCSGALPGCTADFKKVTYPILHFNVSRPYHYSQRKHKGKFHGLFKHALAYAFSTLPEMVDIGIKTLNSSETTTQAPATAAPVVTTAAPSAQWPADHLQGTPYPPQPTSAPSPPPVSPAQPPEEAGSAFNRWWTGAGTRRLSSRTTDSGPLQEEPAEPATLADNQVVVSFPRGLPYKLDRQLVERMLENGYFVEIEDEASKEQGPLRITSLYRIDEGVEEGDDDMSENIVSKAAVPLHVLALVLLSVVAAGACLVAAVTAKRESRRGLKAAFNWLTPRATSGYVVPASCTEEE